MSNPLSAIVAAVAAWLVVGLAPFTPSSAQASSFLKVGFYKTTSDGWESDFQSLLSQFLDNGKSTTSLNFITEATLADMAGGIATFIVVTDPTDTYQLALSDEIEWELTTTGSLTFVPASGDFNGILDFDNPLIYAEDRDGNQLGEDDSTATTPFDLLVTTIWFGGGDQSPFVDEVPFDVNFRFEADTSNGGGFAHESFTLGVTGIPEPASLALLGFGAVAMLSRRCRHR